MRSSAGPGPTPVVARAISAILIAWDGPTTPSICVLVWINDRWRIQVVAKNVGNSEGLGLPSGLGATLSGGRAATFIQPRTIGVDLSAKF